MHSKEVRKRETEWLQWEVSEVSVVIQEILDGTLTEFKNGLNYEYGKTVYDSTSKSTEFISDINMDIQIKWVGGGGKPYAYPDETCYVIFSGNHVKPSYGESINGVYLKERLSYAYLQIDGMCVAVNTRRYRREDVIFKLATTLIYFIYHYFDIPLYTIMSHVTKVLNILNI